MEKKERVFLVVLIILTISIALNYLPIQNSLSSTSKNTDLRFRDFKYTWYGNPWPLPDTICPNPWCSNNCLSNCSCYRICGILTCWCICDCEPNIYVVNVDDSNQTKLTENPTYDDYPN